MSARATWKGSISFGLVNVPVKLYKATEDKDIHLNQLHRDWLNPKTDKPWTAEELAAIDPATGKATDPHSGKEVLTRINLKKICPLCGKEISQGELVSGMQVGDKWITVSEQERANCTIKSTKTMEISAFVPIETVVPYFSGDPDWLGPDDAGKKAFHLLLKAMAAENKVAVTKLTKSSREKLVCLQAVGKLIRIQELCYADELRPTSEVEQVLPDVSDKEIAMGVMLLKQMETDNPDMTQYHDIGREKLADLIEKKAQGIAITVEKVDVLPPTEDLMSALMNSLKQPTSTPAAGSK